MLDFLNWKKLFKYLDNFSKGMAIQIVGIVIESTFKHLFVSCKSVADIGEKYTICYAREKSYKFVWLCTVKKKITSFDYAGYIHLWRD